MRSNKKPIFQNLKHELLYDAILKGKINSVRFLIDNYPNLLNIETPNNETPLHWAAQQGQLKIVEYLLQKKADPCVFATDANKTFERTPLCYAALHGYENVVNKMLEFSSVRDNEDPNWLDAIDCFLQKKPPTKLMPVELDRNGNTLLHDKIRHDSPKKIYQFLLEIGYENFLIMSKTHNHAGLLPIHIIEKEAGIPINADLMAKNNIMALLMLFMSQNVMKDLSATIDPNETLSNSPFNPNDPYYEVLIQIASDAVNYARTIIKKSNTHTQVNLLTYDELHHLTDQIKLMRKTTSKQTIEQEVSTIEQQHLGNCHEFATLVFNYMKKECELRSLPISIEVCTIEKSDHVIVVAGKHLNPMKSDPYRIVVDAWKGDIFSYEKKNTELSCFTPYRSSDVRKVNTTSFFNPYYHHLSPANKTELRWKGKKHLGSK